MAEIEKKVVELATKARDNKLSMEEMQGRGGQAAEDVWSSQC